MNTFKELDCVVLTRDLPAHRLEAGDVGAVVHCHPGASAYEVEFVAAAGSTVAPLTLDLNSLRPFGGRELLHAREVAAA